LHRWAKHGDGQQHKDDQSIRENRAEHANLERMNNGPPPPNVSRTVDLAWRCLTNRGGRRWTRKRLRRSGVPGVGMGCLLGRERRTKRSAHCYAAFCVAGDTTVMGAGKSSAC
jgi:hypothetical protein